MRIKIRSGGQGGGDKPTSFIGKLVATLFLSVFVAIGSLLATKGLEKAQEVADTLRWIERPCAIESSEVQISDTGNSPYTPTVTYTYTHGGKSFTGTTLNNNTDSETRDYEEAQDILLRYPAGSNAKVWIDPDEPGRSALDRGNFWILGFVGAGMSLFVLLFAGLPLLAIIAMWWPGKKTSGDPKSNKKRKRSKKRGGRGGRIGLAIFGLIFGGFGATFFYFVTVHACLAAWQAQQWTAVPCVVESATLQSYQSDDSTTYRANVLYRYTLNGKTYRSNRSDFAVNQSRGSKESQQKILDRYPVGAKATCYADPARPGRATLNRELWQGRWWGFIGFVFALIGFALVFGGLMHKGAKKENRWRPDHDKQSRPSSGLPAGGGHGDGPVTLKPTTGRVAKALGLLLLAGFWNGIVSVFLVQLVGSYLKGDPDICLTLFLIPFVAIGLGMIGAFLRQVLLIFAPKVAIEIGRQSIPLGDSTPLRWQVLGRPGKVTKITITLLGEEHATYTRGTDTVTDTEAFFEQVLAGESADDVASDFDTIRTANERGEVVLDIPQESMHSFEAKHNKITWKLRVVAQVPRWPDPKDEYELTVLPIPIDPK